MKINITANKAIHEVQDEFQKEYPYLKLEFYRYPLLSKNHNRKSQPISSELTIAMARRVQTEGPLNMDSDRSIEEVESDFNNIFGLNVVVFRKSGNVWIKTSLTHHWSLGRQNLEGRQLSAA